MLNARALRNSKQVAPIANNRIARFQAISLLMLSLSRRVLRKLRRTTKLARTKARLQMQCLKGKPVVVDYGWVKLPYSNDGDLQELHYHQRCIEYYHNEVAIFKQYVKPGDTVLDIGANMGFTTMVMASLMKGKGAIYSFEPLKQTYEKLERTVEANGTNGAKIVHPVNFGLGSRDSVEKIFSVGQASGNNSIVNESSDRTLVGEIAVTTLDSYLKTHLPADAKPITFVKIDTEGFELEVLRGAVETLKNYRPVIYIELCKEYLESSLASAALLESLGYSFVGGLDIENAGNGSNFVAIAADS